MIDLNLEEHVLMIKKEHVLSSLDLAYGTSAEILQLIKQNY